MPGTPLPHPHPRVHPEHKAARPEAAEALCHAIPEVRAELAPLENAHILSARDFEAPMLKQLFRHAACYELGQMSHAHPAHGRILSNLFLDGSRNHTRLSFNSAWLRLGGTLLNFERSAQEITHGRHAPDEVAELCSNYGDLAVVSTEESGQLAEMIDLFRIPLINAGNGDEHPTHAMADLYTILKWRPDLCAAEVAPERRLQIGVFGNVARMPTLRSFLYALARFPQAVERVVLFSPAAELARGQREELAAMGLNVVLWESLMDRGATAMQTYRKLLPEMDVLNIHMCRKDDFSRLDFIEAIAYFKPDAMVLNADILHQEFSDRLNGTPHNGYFAQARGTVFLRMALMESIIGQAAAAR